MKSNPTLPDISLKDLAKARELFLKNEPRDVFYRCATTIIKNTRQAKTELSITDALALLLQTWNKAYYQYIGGFKEEDYEQLELLSSKYEKYLVYTDERTIEQLNLRDYDNIKTVFSEFEQALGPVGAAKCLHLLAPNYFPIWDRRVAEGYSCDLKITGQNAETYIRFMEAMKSILEGLGGHRKIGDNPLKAIDEYNYCHFTKGWI